MATYLTCHWTNCASTLILSTGAGAAEVSRTTFRCISAEASTRPLVSWRYQSPICLDIRDERPAYVRPGHQRCYLVLQFLVSAVGGGAAVAKVADLVVGPKGYRPSSEFRAVGPQALVCAPPRVLNLFARVNVDV